MQKQVIRADKVAPPGGAYSHAIRVGDPLFIAGQVALDVEGKLVGKGDSAAQTRQAMANIQAPLEAAGAIFDNVVTNSEHLRDRHERQTGHAAGVGAVSQRTVPYVHPGGGKATGQPRFHGRD